MMKVAFCTLGCRVNLYETEAMSEKFIKNGYTVCSFDEKADVYIINTCTVTSTGDKKSRQMIRRAKHKNPDGIVAVVGCYSQISPNKVSSIEGVDIVLGTRNKGDIVYYVNKFMNEGKKIVNVGDVLKNNTFENLEIENYQTKTRAFLKIQDGCNQFCSYCLIPYARGAICSKKPENLLKEVKKLAQNNFKEIILSGINISSYGKDLKEDWNLLKILKKVNEIDGIERIRIGSVDPNFFTEETIEELSNLKKMCRHFHISLQSGCDDTLKRMNRNYTTAQYKHVVEKLRNTIEGISITTDIIVGFPGESDREFEETYNFLKDIKLSKMHIFRYSKRKGTKAALMKEQIDEKVKEIRSHKLIELDEIHHTKFIKRFIGQKLRVLFEKQLHNRENYFEGYSDNYIKVIAKSNSDISDKILDVEVTGIEGECAVAKILK